MEFQNFEISRFFYGKLQDFTDFFWCFTVKTNPLVSFKNESRYAARLLQPPGATQCHVWCPLGGSRQLVLNSVPLVVCGALWVAAASLFVTVFL